MPAISVDTFFACSLMVLLVLSAMATTSKFLYPQINNVVDENIAERYSEISKYLLLSSGTPSSWGQNSQITPDMFGLAETDSDNPYELDIDKVTRLNSENTYAVSYAQIFTTLKISDVSFRIEIKPIFDVAINLTATFAEVNETIYQFEITTTKHGVPIQTELKCYTIAENYFDAYYAYAADGKSYLNITIPNNVTGPALLAAFARSTYDTKITSFNICAFEHNLAEPKPQDTFLRLSPLNYTLTAALLYPEIVLTDTHALAFDYNSTLPQTAASNESATYDIPHFLDSSPTLIVVTGWNSTNFFTEWTVYPQIPLQMGANFEGLASLSNVFAYSYIITINSVFYECTVWLGGPKE
jgi:hypothetical protein